MDTPTVLIISDEADFSRRITARWQMERNVPMFTLLSGELWPRFAVDGFDVAIIGELRRDLLSVVLEALHSTGQPIFCVCQSAATAQLVRERWLRVSILRPSEHWLETLVLAASEAVHRSRAESRARMAEFNCAALQRQATLGRYMVEMRHSLNNALTSVLGNSDLLLLEPGSLSAQTRAQIETIRNMTLRIHEIMQRFSSLEKEMNVVAQQAERDSGKSFAAAAAGD
ncbi:Histidine kinase A-like protein [Candidatus Sulfotelmatobacter kueseliae]|uniref:Histidine kinase A-like protein n=1 Tax=Candidatus Sulfotelmatobacter kueseliae TaxID=2042962 RepID=A0A2U3KRK5_9BACT|nr:Histidine kinase A-like protein [Candidatus Sulfotelmatobacter kueseliae]